MPSKPNPAQAQTIPRPDEGPALLPVDRVLSRPGFGTVTTGLSAAVFAKATTSSCSPGAASERTRSASAGSTFMATRKTSLFGTARRCQSRGVAPEEVRRGDLLIARRKRDHESFLAELRRLDVSERFPTIWSPSRRCGRMFGPRHPPYRREQTRLGPPGVDAPLALWADQRIVLRRPGAHGQGTVAGGRVVDPTPTHKKEAPPDGAGPAATRVLELDVRIAALVDETGQEGLLLNALLLRLPFPQARRCPRPFARPR